MPSLRATLKESVLTLHAVDRATIRRMHALTTFIERHSKDLKTTTTATKVLDAVAELALLLGVSLKEET